MMNYENLIYQTQSRNPNYKEIKFDQFLELCFCRKDLFLKDFDLRHLEDKLTAKYGNKDNCFKEFGVLKTIELSTIKYYQKGVGIEGPRHSFVDDPVFVVTTEQRSILLNGYHRTTLKMLNNIWTIEGYDLRLD